MSSHATHQMSPEMQQCIQNCMECHRICLETVPHCLQMGGKHAEAAHIRLLLDCAEICQTSANFMIRGSDLHTRTCAVCAEVCERCAEAALSGNLSGDESRQLADEIGSLMAKST